MSTGLKWDDTLPASYWLLAARLFATDTAYFYWIHTTEAGDVRLGLNCNDHFVPGSDAEWVNPEDVAELLALIEAAQPPGSGSEGMKAADQAAMDWVAKKRGYPDGRSWTEKRTVVHREP